MKNLSIFLFVFTLCINPFEGIKTTVIVQNGLSQKKWLRVSCLILQTNQRFGVHYLKPGGKDYQVTFDDALYVNDIFKCRLGKGSDFKIFKDVVMYSKNPPYRFKPHYGTYTWKAEDDGIYYFNNQRFKKPRPPFYEKMFDW
ncbi:hypothetical protein EUTSA_v10009050mg [Eutrema salsugineum]|uniref:Uncharacterized protein n=1 Tax=Eutrema salsugineum TaxID=72664 RepID=V4L7C6_EUTSA|nr:hypothetical protein EUTSA_v10009050mg [Eutrema salsugineum]